MMSVMHNIKRGTFGLSALAGLVLGAGVLVVLVPAQSSMGGQDSGVLRVKTIELVDAEGRVSGVLDGGSRGGSGPTLQFLSVSGHSRILLSFGGGELPIMEMAYNPSSRVGYQKIRLSFETNSNQIVPNLSLGTVGRELAELGVWPTTKPGTIRSPYLRFLQGNREPQAGEEAEMIYLGMNDWLSANAEPVLRFRRATGQVELELPTRTGTEIVDSGDVNDD